MRLPAWVLTSANVVAAVPFGWSVGVLAAYLVAGRNFGQLPVMTVPVGTVAAIAFARSSLLTPANRLAIMVAGTMLMIVVSL
jgi:hypothetical protein